LLIALFAYKLLAHLLIVIAVILSIIFGLMFGLLNSYVFAGIFAGGSVSALIVEELLKRVQSLAETRVFKWFRNVEEKARSRAQELEYRIKHFDHYVPEFSKT